VPANGLTFILNGAPAGATINPSTGVFTWIPSEAQGPGVYTFDVVVSDDGTPTLSATQPVTVTVNEVNTAPTVIDPGAQADAEADSVSLFIAASDSDIPVNTLAFSASGLPDGLSINPVTGEISGTIDYTANAGSPFNVTVTVTDDGTPPRSGQATFVWDVADTNRGPLPLDDVVVATEDTPLTIDVLANDTDPDGDPLTISGASDPANGSVTLLGGSVIYTPDPDFYGPDSFIYTVTDGRGEFASASVDINVSAVNDPPDLNALTELNVNEGSLAIFSTSATDVEGNSVTFSVSGAPAGAAIDPVTGTFRWIPDESQGPGSYVFDVVGTDDGAPPAVGSRQVRINVAEVNAAPIVANPGTQSTAENQAVSLFISATDPDIPAGTLRYSATGLPPGLAIDPVSGEIAGLIPFDAAAGSPYTVTVTATDDGAPQRSGSAVFSWSIGNTNRPPTAFDITVFAEAGVPVTLILSGSDPDGDPLYYSIDSGPLQGALAGGPRLYDYTALITAGGSDSFTFIVSDGSLQATGNVSITIIPNLPPVGEPDEYDVRRAGVVVVESPGVLDNDGDPEGRQITAVLETPPSHGTVKLQPDGSFFYEHTDVLVDSDAFTYRVDDGMQLSEEITVQLNIEENLPPVAIADSLTIDEDTAVVFRPLENDFDPNNEPILVSDILWREGFLSWSLDGTFRYAPPPDWNGTATIVYEITDGELIALGIVTIVVQPVNDPPTAVDARLTGDSGQVLQIDLRPYASDVDGDPLSFLLESPRHAQVREVGPGRFELDLDGVITDLPPLAFVASDPSGATDTSLLMVTVRIPAELVGVPALVTDDIGRNGGDVGESFDPPGSPPLVTGLRLMIGSIFDTFRAFRVPMLALLLVLLGSLWMGLSRRFAFSSTPTLLPLGSRRKVDIVMAPSSAGVPARREPGSHQSVVHRFGADETGIIATGARSMLRSEVWVEVETPEGDAWVNGEYLTEQQQASFFRDDARVRQLVTQLVERIYRGDDLLPATAGHDLHVALYGPPVRFAAGALPRLLAGESVYWWWGPEGDTPRNQGTFAETVGESFTSAFRNRDAHVVTPTLPIPVEFVNMHSLVVGHHDMGEGWRVFIRYEQDEPSIAGLMREAHANPAAMHGRMEFQGV
nr:Ig-like domain-containing protein [Acidimicrobiia bacterium]